MTMTVGQSIIMIAAIILATVLTRFLPFIIFGGGRPIPDFVNCFNDVFAKLFAQVVDVHLNRVACHVFVPRIKFIFNAFFGEHFVFV